MMYTAEMGSGSMINVPSYMKVGAGVQVLLRYFSQKFERPQVGIFDGTDLCCTPLR
jgi:hypothetical protein